MINDPIFTYIKAEEGRQLRQLQMIPSENIVSTNVMKAVGSVLMNKYAEGQPFKRYYQGNENIDKIESLVEQRALEAFGLNEDEWGVNVQPPTGSFANLAVYNAFLSHGDKIMSMYLYDGGHLSHGWKMSEEKKVSFSAKYLNSVFYHVNPDTEVFDYDEIEKMALIEKPKMIISGGTAYPREIDYKRMGEIAKKVGAYYMADVAHEAGLIAGGANSSPFKYADFVTMTTRKTLRGPIGAMIFCKKQYLEEIDKSVFPGLQGGPMNHSIAGIGVALGEALQPEFKEYAKQVVVNAQVLASELAKKGLRIVSGGTDKHLVLIDLRGIGLADGVGGVEVALALEGASIIVNKNTIPNDTGKPWRPSGIRLGTPSLTSRGMKEKEMIKIAGWISEIIMDWENVQLIAKTKKEVEDFALGFPARV
jgi:glycine hydroxymethyltransferase